MNCDCETPSISNSCYRVARKQHTCCECRRAIKPGDQYREDSGLWDGEWETYRTCLRCDRVRDALELDTDCCVAFGALRETLRDRLYDRHRWSAHQVR